MILDCLSRVFGRKDYWFDGEKALRYNKFRMCLRAAKLLLLLFLLLGTACQGLTLRESIEICLKNNPEILAQKEKIKEADSRVGQAFSAYLPSLKLEGQYGKQHQMFYLDNLFPGSVSILPDYNSSLLFYGASISQNLFSGGRLNNTLEMAQAQLEIAKEELKRKEQELAYRATVAYYNLLRAWRMVVLQADAEKIARAHLGQVENYIILGRVGKSDLLRAKVMVAQEEFSKIKLENNAALSRIEFNAVLGKKQEEDLTEAGLNEIYTLPMSAEVLLAQTYKQRPEWKIFGLQKKIREKEINLARAEFFPNVWVNGITYKYKVDYADWSYRLESWAVFGWVSWNIFDGLKTPYHIREAQAGQAATKFSGVDLEKRIQSEVEEARLSFESEKRRIQIAQEEVDLAEERLTLAREEYRKGVRNNIELLEAQHSLSRARSDLLQARSDYEIAKAKLNFATGAEIFKPL